MNVEHPKCSQSSVTASGVHACIGLTHVHRLGQLPRAQRILINISQFSGETSTAFNTHTHTHTHTANDRPIITTAMLADKNKHMHVQDGCTHMHAPGTSMCTATYTHIPSIMSSSIRSFSITSRRSEFIAF